jgi:hypothetical protein
MLMDLSPLIVIVAFVALVALSTWGRTQSDDATGSPRSGLKPPGEPGDTDRPDTVIYP